MPHTAPSEVVILGAGFIGLSFAAVFQDAGWRVTLVEPDAARRDAALSGIATQLAAIALSGQRAGGNGAVDIRDTPGDALRQADLVLECGPEDLPIKTAIFAGLLRDAGPHTILATASSAITMSLIVADPIDQARCLVAHPVNPPSVLRLIELVPAPGTTPAARLGARKLFAAAGFSPVMLGQEIEGFVLNRLQGAVLREAYRLVAEGVVDVEGLDRVMREGLGPRWALSGPFETAELNTPGGIRAHAARMGPAYRRMGEARGETVDWTAQLVMDVERQRRAICPEDALPRRAAWRARAVAQLVAFRNSVKETGDE